MDNKKNYRTLSNTSARISKKNRSKLRFSNIKIYFHDWKNVGLRKEASSEFQPLYVLESEVAPETINASKVSSMSSTMTVRGKKRRQSCRFSEKSWKKYENFLIERRNDEIKIDETSKLRLFVVYSVLWTEKFAKQLLLERRRIFLFQWNVFNEKLAVLFHFN